MVRKVIQISLLFIYILFNAGLSYSFHFCEEELSKINFFTEKEMCCPEEEEMQGCCEDLSRLEFPNAEQVSANFLDFLPLKILTTDFYHGIFAYMQLVSALSETVPFIAYKDHPLTYHSPIYIKNQVFLI